MQASTTGRHSSPYRHPANASLCLAQHYREAGKDKKKDTFWKRLALTKKTKLTINIPQRQFMPSKPGSELIRKVNDKLNTEVEKIINQ